ncbi:hypothetical protein F4778DRAFT_569181 [Xylariomycetidae sp. FL2044]|nr:hypothetical protein F4778DRAFT_569181 [Xylariomycetidae sp. FL2044]
MTEQSPVAGNPHPSVSPQADEQPVSASDREARQNSTTIKQIIYYYNQIFCGGCGRYITDAGGFLSPQLAAKMDYRTRRGPGVDLLYQFPEYFSADKRQLVLREKGLLGLAGAGHVMQMQTVPDHEYPVIYLLPWLCYHEDKVEDGVDVDTGRSKQEP